MFISDEGDVFFLPRL